MAQTVFEFDDYKKFIKAAFDRQENGGRGQRYKLAQFLGCQDSYVSLVLSGDRQFSVEQAEGVARFLHLNDEEKEFFILLLLRDRSGTVPARRYFTEKLDEKRREFQDFRARVQIDKDLSDADKMRYYGNPLMAKVHMFLTIPGKWTVEELAERFSASPAKMQEICRFLSSKGFIKEKNGRYFEATKFLFLDKRSPFIVQHHSSWRLDAISAIQDRHEDGMHLSMVFTLSEKDAEALRQKIAKFIEESSSLIKESKEETLMALNLDFYKA